MRTKIKEAVYQAGLIGMAILTFCLPFLLPRSAALKTAAVITRYNNSYFVPIIIILLLLALAVKHGRLSATLTAVVVFSASGLALLGLWASMYTESNVIAGILPRIDALSFYTSAMALVEKGYLTGYTQRRPLFSGFFAFLTWLFGRDMQSALLALAFLCALAMYLTLMEARRAFGNIGAALFFIPQFMYYRMYIGNVMSETLSFFLGMAATALFLRALTTRNEIKAIGRWLFPLAVFVYTLAQLARPGAIVTLLLLVLFALIYPRGLGRIDWKSAGLSILAGLLAYLVNKVMFGQLTLNTVSQVNNFGYGIYGVAAGGKSWAQIFRDHPEIMGMTAGVRERYMLEIIARRILTRPGDFVRGMMVQFDYVFSIFPVYTYNIYSYMLSANAQADAVLIGTYYLLSGAGIGYAIARRKERLPVFIGLLAAGFLLSLPVAPAYQSQYMRYYPATIPLFGLLPAAGWVWVRDIMRRKAGLMRGHAAAANRAATRAGQWGLYIMLAAALMCVLIGPYLTAALAPGEIDAEIACEAGESAALLPLYEGSAVRVRVITDTWLPFVSLENFRKFALNIPKPVMKEYFRDLRAPIGIFPSINLATDEAVYAIVDEAMLPEETGLYAACGRIEDDYGKPAETGYFYPRVVELVGQY